VFRAGDYEAMTTDEIARTVEAIARVQLPNGCIPWFAGGHADPWDHIEAAMALTVGGHYEPARAAYRWSASVQSEDGSWPARFVDGRVVDGTLDANFTAYIAVGVWHHWLATKDGEFLQEMWPVVDRAMDFVLELQDDTGAIRWARDESYRPWPAALITSSSCIHLSLHCAVGIASAMGQQRPDWELAIPLLANAISGEHRNFDNKDRYSMDWYYPILGRVVAEARARDRIADRWDLFVVDGLGAKCVVDRPWVTAGETCELVIALDGIGMTDEARRLFTWIQHLRDDDGGYWTGATYPDGTVWPVEKPTWNSAAVVLAADVLSGTGPTAEVFKGEGMLEAAPLSRSIGDAL
jgi:hypothetical protein